MPCGDGMVTSLSCNMATMAIDTARSHVVCYHNFDWRGKMRYPLVMTNIAMENGPFIDGLPMFTWVYLLKMEIFHGYASHNQRVDDLGC